MACDGSSRGSVRCHCAFPFPISGSRIRMHSSGVSCCPQNGCGCSALGLMTHSGYNLSSAGLHLQWQGKLEGANRGSLTRPCLFTVLAPPLDCVPHPCPLPLTRQGTSPVSGAAALPLSPLTVSSEVRAAFFLAYPLLCPPQR